MTIDSTGITFSSAPSISLEGRYLSLAGQSDMYIITQHTAGDTAAQIDAPFILASGSYNYYAYALEYDLFSDTIVIDSSNNKVDFNAGGGELTATLTKGTYTPSSLCTELDTRLTAASGESYTVSFDSVTRKFSMVQGGTTFSLLFVTGSNAHVSAARTLGFDTLDYTGALTYSSAYALSGILRITKPLTTYREAPVYSQASKEAGKIFFIDSNTMLNDYPISRMAEAMPNRFTIKQHSPDGLMRIKLNGSLTDEKARVEVNYIPVIPDLQDNDVSIPIVPTPYTKFLVYGTSYLLLMEKSDSKAQQYFSMAQAELKAMVNDARKNGQNAGINYGRLIPRMSTKRYYGFRT